MDSLVHLRKKTCVIPVSGKNVFCHTRILGHFVCGVLQANKDSSGDDMFLTQSSFRSDNRESDSDDQLTTFWQDSFSADLPTKYAPYGVQFSDISDAEELISSCQVAENQYSKERFGTPIPEADLASKSRKR